MEHYTVGPMEHFHFCKFNVFNDVPLKALKYSIIFHCWRYIFSQQSQCVAWRFQPIFQMYRVSRTYPPLSDCTGSPPTA